MLRAIDALEINFVDSAARSEFKLNTSTERGGGKSKGIGEKRLYITNTKDPKELDDFFEFNITKYFFFKKIDLIEYLRESKKEYLNPSQDYINDISSFYNENCKLISEIEKDYIKVYFTRTHDSQNRYYLVLDGRGKNNPNRQAYAYISNICLPRLTKLNFVKLQDQTTKDIYIYIKPNFIDIPKVEKANIEVDNNQKITKSKNRKLQPQYRFALLDKMPTCVITEVGDDRLLIACHIKPYAICDENEEFDVENGIILTPTYHYLFDIGFISFDDQARIIVSDFLSKLNQKRLHIATGQETKINSTDKRKEYLKYHRENIFQRVIIDSEELIK